MQKVLLIALSGACGTLARYWLSGAVHGLVGRNFPWGTWAVNILGCFLFGLVWSLAEDRILLSAATRMILLVGFMGAFTTFSTLIFESSTLMRDAEWLKLGLNLAGQTIFGFVAVYLGVSAGRGL